MELFKFNGDWETFLHLPVFAEKLNNDGLGHFLDKENREKGLFRLIIGDSEDESPDPTAAQMAAIQFIQAHQLALLDAIFEYHKTVIYPSPNTEN